jgi:glycosyltransferase involved in cell wall biosynthesis
LPHKTEGFYLPALEAMYLKTLLICPDCIGNRSFCIDAVTCFAPNYITDDIILAVKNGLLLDNKERALLVDKAYEYGQASTLQKEREKFLNTLYNLSL